MYEKIGDVRDGSGRRIGTIVRRDGEATAAAWATLLVIFLTIGIFIAAFWLLGKIIQLTVRYPKVMLPTLGILLVGGVAYFLFFSNSIYSYQPTTSANTYRVANATPATRKGAAGQSAQTPTASGTVRGPAVGPKGIYVGASVRVTTVQLNIRPGPGPDGTPMGKVRQGEHLRVVSGPVWVPTTSDDGQPMQRDWWQVTGWDASGSVGWCSSRYLDVAP